MNILDYSEVKKLLLDDFKEFINEGYTIEQAIAALLEDSIIMMKHDKNNYISVIIALSSFSLESNVIANYLYERLIEIIKKDIGEYKYKLQNDFLNDRDQINRRLKVQDYNIFNDKDYKSRVDMLLGKIL